ncbi:hypothetical protein niasHT_017152 [Heterodera trifolii]|uniref:CCHC-type domain-containing protein n=1 Tax=Heterodera trifolii TaxID=157864 RepID=A0ABD2L949_9BILA
MDKTLAEILEKLTQAIKQQSAPTTITTQPAQNITLPDIHPFLTENAEEFEEWLERFQFALDCAAANMADEAKVKLLMTKLNPAAFGEYKRYCLPEEITKFNFADTKTRLIKLFSHPPSLAIDRYECLRVCREDGENFEIFVNRLKAALRKFRFSELNEEEFKCLVLLTSLKSSSDAKLRQHIFARLTAEDSKTTKTSKLFDKVVEDLNTQLKTEAEAKILEQPKPKINAIQHGKSTPNHQNRGNGRPNQKFSGKSKAKAPPSNCYRCGELHWGQDCPKKENICRKCNRKGHIERQCDKIQAFHQNKGRNFNANTVMLPAAYINSVHSSNLLKAPINVNGTAIGTAVRKSSSSMRMITTQWADRYFKNVQKKHAFSTESAANSSDAEMPPSNSMEFKQFSHFMLPNQDL